MDAIKSGDPIAPVTATHVAAVKEANGVVFRLQYITRNDQALDAAFTSLNFIMKSEQARALGKHLMDAADGLDATKKPA